MSSKPTLFQTLFNQPSQKYAIHPPREQGSSRRRATRRLHTSSQPFPAANSESFPSISSQPFTSSNLTSSPDYNADPTRSNHLDPISDNIAKTITPRHNSPSILHTGPQSTPQSPDSDDEIFYTPLSSPRSSVVMPSEIISPKPMPSSCSSVTSSTPDDDIFSSRSAATSATSISASLTVSNEHDRRRIASYHSSKSRNGPSLAEWSKDVRWLLPPDVTSLSHPSPVSGSIIQGLDLVDVEYEHVPPKSKSHIKSGRKSRRSTSEPMSAVLEEEEDDEHATASHARARSISSPANVRAPRSAHSRSSSTSTRTVTLPTPLPVSSGIPPATGYTSLTLPRAAYTPSRHPGRVSSSVDITRSGLAQTAMSTISINRHAAVPSMGPLRFSRLKASVHTPERLRATLPSPLSFGSHTPPPSKVHSCQVLVQVWAVALDGLDSLLVEERAGKNDSFGYVPGRSFVGRAVECGWEVNSVSKGDWVCGITEVRKVRVVPFNLEPGVDSRVISVALSRNSSSSTDDGCTAHPAHLPASQWTKLRCSPSQACPLTVPYAHSLTSHEVLAPSSYTLTTVPGCSPPRSFPCSGSKSRHRSRGHGADPRRSMHVRAGQETSGAGTRLTWCATARLKSLTGWWIH